MTEKVRFVFEEEVLGVYEHFTNLAAEREPGSKEWTIPQRSDGWFIKISGGVSICVGPTKPDIVKGDIIRHTVEKVIKDEPTGSERDTKPKPSEPALAKAEAG